MTNEELTAKVVELDERATRHTEQLKTAFNQLTELKSIADSVYKLASSVEVLAIKQKTTADSVEKMSGDIEQLKSKPAKRWDNAVSIVFSVVATAILTLALVKIGLM